jgi:hypothetical protein
MAAANHGKKRALAVEILPQPRQADSGGHKRLRPMGAVFGGETRLLAVFGCFPASEAAGSGIIVRSGATRGRLFGGGTCPNTLSPALLRAVSYQGVRHS